MVDVRAILQGERVKRALDAAITDCWTIAAPGVVAAENSKLQLGRSAVLVRWLALQRGSLGIWPLPGRLVLRP